MQTPKPEETRTVELSKTDLLFIINGLNKFADYYGESLHEKQIDALAGLTDRLSEINTKFVPKKEGL